MTRVVFHVDMDAFYASVEQRDDLTLRGRPVVVGGAPQSRGVVAACSYEARAFGVRSAMPCSQAARLCPAAVFVRPRMAHYKDIALRIREHFQAVSETVEPMSIDEAYLEVPPRTPDPDRALDDALPLAQALKRQIYLDLELTCSIGIAPNKFLAKLASGHQKPNGITRVYESAKRAFLAPLPIERMHGVGPATARTLRSLGIQSIGDLQAWNQSRLPGFSLTSGARLIELAQGIDARPLESGDAVKSVSAETTFHKDTNDRLRLRDTIRELSQDVASRLEKRQLRGRAVSVKVRYSDFTTLTRQQALDRGVYQWQDIYRLSCHVIRTRELLKAPLRLIGIGLSQLEPRSEGQLWLPFIAADSHNPTCSSEE